MICQLKTTNSLDSLKNLSNCCTREICCSSSVLLNQKELVMCHFLFQMHVLHKNSYIGQVLDICAIMYKFENAYRGSSPNAVSSNADFDLTRFQIQDKKIRLTRIPRSNAVKRTLLEVHYLVICTTIPSFNMKIVKNIILNINGNTK